MIFFNLWSWRFRNICQSIQNQNISRCLSNLPNFSRWESPLAKEFKSQHPTNRAKHSPRTSSGHPSFPGWKIRKCRWTNCWFFWHIWMKRYFGRESSQTCLFDACLQKNNRVKIKNQFGRWSSHTCWLDASFEIKRIEVRKIDVLLEENLAKNPDLMLLLPEKGLCNLSTKKGVEPQFPKVLRKHSHIFAWPCRDSS